MLDDKVRKLVLVVKSVDTHDTLERWVFSVENTASCSVEGEDAHAQSGKGGKSEKEVTKEIQAILRQITASVTFLPLLSEPCYFDLLVYADQAAEVPLLWEDSDACLISNAEDVRLRSFDTKVRERECAVRLSCKVFSLYVALIMRPCRFTKWTLWCHIAWMRTRRPM